MSHHIDATTRSRRPTVRLGAAALLGAAFLVAACGSPPSPPATGSAGLGGTWTAVRVGDAGPVAGSEPRLQFLVDGRIEGTTGCNSFGGRYAVENGRIRVGDLTQTEIGCPGRVGLVEAAFTRILAGADQIAVGQGRILISGPAGELELVRGGAEADPEAARLAELLAAGEWSIREATGVVGAAQLPPMTFRAGSVVAVGVCGFGASVELPGGDRIVVRETSWDAIGGCPEATDRARADLAALLETVERVEVGENDREVTLHAPAGRIVLVR